MTKNHALYLITLPILLVLLALALAMSVGSTNGTGNINRIAEIGNKSVDLDLSAVQYWAMYSDTDSTCDLTLQGVVSDYNSRLQQYPDVKIVSYTYMDKDSELGTPQATIPITKPLTHGACTITLLTNLGAKAKK